MSESHTKLAKMLLTKPEVLLDLEQKLNSITGKSGVMDKIMMENDLLVKRTLEELGLTARECNAENVYGVLIKRLEHMDEHLYNFLDKPDLSKMSMVCGKVCEMALKETTPNPGFLKKKKKAIKCLRSFRRRIFSAIS